VIQRLYSRKFARKSGGSISPHGKIEIVKKRSKKQLQGLSWDSLMAEWTSWWAAKAPVLLFGAKFGALIALLYGVLAIPFAEQMLQGYLKVNAWVSNGILNLLGQGTHVSEVTIASSSFAIAIRRGCDAVEPTWLLCAAILAFPGTWRRKLAGMLAGIIVLQSLNVVRIVTLYWIGSRFPAAFHSAHLEIWPTLFIIAAIGLFVGWKGWADER
jgi:exosortase H (IPTLxxWG-CTERM-specific)